jgi:hypothetical protein
MDTTTVMEIISRIETAQSFAKEDLDTTFECETTREYRAYVKGQVDALDGVINHLQKYIEGQLSAAENQTGE